MLLSFSVTENGRPFVHETPVFVDPELKWFVNKKWIWTQKNATELYQNLKENFQQRESYTKT